ncbi:MAG: SH3 domain-containing protein [Chloroflexota bacterium]|nr:SH3 domain-containing protein [Chloroflexota bacterium]
MQKRANSLPLWQGIFLILWLGALGITLAALGWYVTRREHPRPPGPLPTAILWTTTPAPTATQTPIPRATMPPPSPTVTTGIAVGKQVRIAGTGSAGLSLRDGPGVSYQRLGVAIEGEVFIVAGGPTNADGLTWWLLRYEADPTREGWGAANYLAIIDGGQ